MARDAAIISSWGAPVPGREAKSLEVFMEFMGFIGKFAAEGKVQPLKAYFAADGSGGLAIVEGKSDVLAEINASDENLKLVSKASLIVQDFKSHLFFGGTDEEVQSGMGVFVQAGQELGYM